MRTQVLVVVVVAVVTGCATAPMSAEEHRTRAAQETERAADHAARYDEGARAAHLDTPAGDVALAPAEYNPTHYEQEAAQAHARAAQKHLDSAHALEADEDAACAGIAPPARAACPLFSPVAVDDVPRGVRITFKDAAAAARAAQTARCQQAFARTRGFTDLPTCALFARDLAVEQRDTAVELTTSDRAGIERLRANVRGHHAPAADATPAASPAPAGSAAAPVDATSSQGS